MKSRSLNWRSSAPLAHPNEAAQRWAASNSAPVLDWPPKGRAGALLLNGSFKKKECVVKEKKKESGVKKEKEKNKKIM